MVPYQVAYGLFRSPFFIVGNTMGNKCWNILGAGTVKVQVETAIKNLKTKDIYFMASSRRAGSVGAFGGNSKGFIKVL
jgi:hypothetical protein